MIVPFCEELDGRLKAAHGERKRTATHPQGAMDFAA